MGRTVRILRERDVRESLAMAACIDACEAAFEAYSTGAAELPSVIHLNVPEAAGEIHVKAGYLHGQPYYAVKMASGFSSLEPVAIDGMVVVFDATDGGPAAFLLDGGYITDLRTGAAGGVAARHLARERVDVVAVIGTGGQARQQIDALAQVRSGFAQIRVWGRNPERASVCADEIRARHGESCSVNAVGSVVEAVDGADLVITCTASSEPLVRMDMLASGVHVTALGSDGPGKQELEPEILRRADLLVVDSRDQCLALGELQHAPDQAGRAVELGAICSGGQQGRTDEDQLTVCDLTGLGAQDVAAANLVMARAGDRGDVFEL